MPPPPQTSKTCDPQASAEDELAPRLLIPKALNFLIVSFDFLDSVSFVFSRKMQECYRSPAPNLKNCSPNSTGAKPLIKTARSQFMNITCTMAPNSRMRFQVVVLVSFIFRVTCAWNHSLRNHPGSGDSTSLY